MKDFIARHWYGMVNRPDGTISRTNLSTTVAWMVATVWISYTVYMVGKIDWELLTAYLSFAVGQSGFSKYITINKRGE